MFGMGAVWAELPAISDPPRGRIKDLVEAAIVQFTSQQMPVIGAAVEKILGRILQW